MSDSEQNVDKSILSPISIIKQLRDGKGFGLARISGTADGPFPSARSSELCTDALQYI